MKFYELAVFHCDTSIVFSKRIVVVMGEKVRSGVYTIRIFTQCGFIDVGQSVLVWYSLVVGLGCAV